MNDDLPITGKLARRGSVSKWKIDGKDQSISGALYDYSMNVLVGEMNSEMNLLASEILIIIIFARSLAYPSGGS